MGGGVVANMLDYLDWRGDLSLGADPFNAVDALILTQLSYVPFEGVVSGRFDERRTLADAFAAYRPDEVPEPLRNATFEENLRLFEKLARSERFGGAELCGYDRRTDPQLDLQFAAITFLLGDGTAFVAFRGTDGTIVGWREDFDLSFMDRTPGQQCAAEYLDRHFADCPLPLRVGGHSKGGNLALYAAVCCTPELRERVTAVYSFDGPGFRDEFTQSEAYLRVLPKLVSVIPQSSLIGQLMSSGAEHRIVRSDAVGMYQHQPYSWQVLGSRFEELEELSRYGAFLNRMLDGWISELDDTTRQKLVEAIFDVLEAPETETFRDINKNKTKNYAAILRALMALTPEQRGALKQALSTLAASSRQSLLKKPTERSPLPSHTQP